jgi:hypothetical protein
MSKSVLSFSLAFLVGFYSVPCLAEGPVVDPVAEEVYEVYKLPEPTWLPPPTEDMACYNLDQFKALLVMDSELKLYESAVPRLYEEIGDLKLAAEARKAYQDAADQQVAWLRAETVRMNAKWQAENKARHKAENKSVFGSWVPWVISGTLTALSVGLVAGLVASK